MLRTAILIHLFKKWYTYTIILIVWPLLPMKKPHSSIAFLVKAFFLFVLFFQLLNVIYYVTHSDPLWHVVLSEWRLIMFVLEGLQSSHAWNVPDSRTHYNRLWNIQLCCLSICEKKLSQIVQLECHKCYDITGAFHKCKNSNMLWIVPISVLICYASPALLCLFILRGLPPVSDQYQLRGDQDKRKQKCTSYKIHFL